MSDDEFTIGDLKERGDKALEALELYARTLRNANNMPLTQNRPFVALHDDIALEVERMRLNHRHLLERSQTATDGLVVPGQG